ncbi:hypothetical protein CVT24_009028 [Panaeolus cyanescens]|uniref:Gfo/Idh/MocA-like oxidoreductase N-terminal domain-containing protein n=1 Tax=Panaeolus cyanescens TaxID=181874 RepID=A0A409YAK1_9AGAR|nr:hypothetical protein CVT24_009028 [Panaeolus cyanescens]
MSSSSQPLRVGFVGLSTQGWASSTIAPAMLSHKDKYKLVAVSTTSPQSSAQTASKYTSQPGYEVKAYHGSTSQIASDPDVDLVAVSVKAPLHRDAVLPVIEQGKDIFIEWPVGKSLQETLEIAEAAKRKGIKTLIGTQGRTSPVIAKLKEIVDSGVLGQITSSTFYAVMPREFGLWGPTPRVNESYTCKKENGATIIAIGAGHLVDIFSHVLGGFTSVTAFASQQYPTHHPIDAQGKPTGESFPSEQPDHYTFSGPLPNGGHGTFILRVGPKSQPGQKKMQWEIEGENGFIRVEIEELLGAYPNVTHPDLYLNGKKVEVEGTRPGYDDVSIYTHLWEEYAKGPGQGKYATTDDAVRARRIVDAVERSVAEGRTIVL